VCGTAHPPQLTPPMPPVHAAVLAINEAVDRGVAAQTMVALRNPNAMLLDLREVLAGAYQEMLHQAKLEKGSNARNRVRRALGGTGRRAAPSLMCWWVLPAGGVRLGRRSPHAWRVKRSLRALVMSRIWGGSGGEAIPGWGLLDPELGVGQRVRESAGNSLGPRTQQAQGGESLSSTRRSSPRERTSMTAV